MTKLGRLADYEAPWVGRTGLALIVALWLFFTFVAFVNNVVAGVGVLIVGGAVIVLEVWIERKGESHPTLVLAWRLGSRLVVGIVLISVSVVHARWAAVIPVLFGFWLILSGLGGAWLVWRERRGPFRES